MVCLIGSVGATLIIMSETVTWPLDGTAFVAGTSATGVVVFAVRDILLVTACNAGSVTAGEVAEFDATEVAAMDGADMFSIGPDETDGVIAGV